MISKAANAPVSELSTGSSPSVPGSVVYTHRNGAGRLHEDAPHGPESRSGEDVRGQYDYMDPALETEAEDVLPLPRDMKLIEMYSDTSYAPGGKKSHQSTLLSQHSQLQSQNS